MFDNWNGTTVVNDDNLKCIVKGKTFDIAERKDLCNMEKSADELKIPNNSRKVSLLKFLGLLSVIIILHSPFHIKT